MNEATPTTPGPQPAPEPKRRGTARRLARGLVRVAVGVFVVGLVLIVAVLASFNLSSGLREAVLVRALERAFDELRASLPGTLEVQARWPQIGVLEFDDLVWTDENDTLLTLGHLQLSVDLDAVVKRRVRVRALRVDRVDARVPALQHAFAQQARESVTVSDSLAISTPGTLPWFDPGRLEGLPDLRIDVLELTAIRARTPEQDVVIERLEAALDLDPQSHQPWLRASLDAELPGLAKLAWELEGDLGDSTTLRFAPIRIEVAEESMESATSASSDVSVLPLDGSLVLPRDLLARLRTGDLGVLRWHGDLIAGDLGALRSTGRWDRTAWDAELDFVAPAHTRLVERALARAALDTLPVVSTALETWPADDRYALHANANGRGTEYVRAEIELDVAPWLSRAQVNGSWEGGVAQLDTFVVVREGLELTGRGNASREGVDARVQFAVDSEVIARSGLDLLPPDTFVRARGRARAVGAWPLPDLDFDFAAAARGAFGEIPAVTVRGRHRGARTSFDARLTEGARLQERSIESAAVHFDGTIDAEQKQVRGRVGLALEVDAMALETSSLLRASQAAGLQATIDTLRFAARDTRWQLGAPFAVTADTSGSMQVEGLWLTSDAGQLRLDAHTAHDSVEVDADIAMALDRAFLFTLLPDSLHSFVPADTTRISLRARIRGPLLSPSAHTQLGISLEGEDRLAPLVLDSEVWLRAEGHVDFAAAPASLPERGVAVQFEVLHDGAPWLSAQAATAGRLDIEQRRFVRAERDSIQVDVHATDVDLATLAALVASPIAVRGALDGRIAGGVSHADLRADVDFGIRDFAMQQSDGSWWESEIAMRLDGSGTFDGEVAVDSLSLVTRLGEVRGHGRFVDDQAEVVLRGDLALPGTMFETLLAPSFTYDLPADTLAVQFELLADGPAASPSGYAEFTLGLRGARDFPPLTLRATTWMRGGASMPWPGTAPDELPARGLWAHLRLAHADSVWVQANARVPAEWELAPWTFDPLEAETRRVELRTTSLDVAKLAELAGLGAFGRLSGDLRVELQAESTAGVASMQGKVDSRRFRAELPDGSWMQARAAIRLSGDAAQSRVDGGVTIEGGVLRVPDVPPPLHDSQGDALLWGPTRLAVAGAAPDSLATPPEPDPVVASMVPDIDVSLSIPGNLRLRGTGLDVELSGELSARTISGAPTVVGVLRATRGSYEFLGRRFQVESGVVEFYGDLDPQLDLRLVTTLRSNLYFVQMRGTVLAPRFELSSDPPQSEGDIVSALLFGRPIDELDEGQTTLLRQRTQEVATQLGANLLAQRIGQEVGVDVLSIQASGDDGAQSLVVGKYLSPDVLVQYEQVLEEGRAALVRIEYALSRFFKVETTASQGEHSGIELKWSRDY